MDYISHNLGETQKIAEELASKIKPGDWVLLFGDLGSGKTTFTKYFAQSLGVERNITSPTFVIMKNYKTKAGQTLYHIDAYRLDGSNGADSICIEDVKNDKNSVVVVEWPEKIIDSVPKNAKKLYFKYISEDQRKITIEE